MKRAVKDMVTILARSPLRALVPGFMRDRLRHSLIVMARSSHDDSPAPISSTSHQLGSDLAGNVALVTGGNSGIGRAAALALARSGSAVGIVGRDENRNSAMLAELQAIGVPAAAVTADVTDRERVGEIVPTIERQLGKLSILVNCAGVGAGKGILEVQPAEWDRVLDTDLTAPFLLMQDAARSMVDRKGGKIVNISSIGGLLSFPSPAFGAAKAGLMHLTRCAAQELGPYNVQVNAIAPGWIDTRMTSTVKLQPRYKRTLQKTPAGRWGEPDEIASAILYLVSPASDFVTGTTLVVDGGLTIGTLD